MIKEDNKPQNSKTQNNRPGVGHHHDAVNPLLVEVTRGNMVESRHRAAIAVVDRQGRVVLKIGDIDRPIYARSAIKPLQAIALVESGAAEAFGLSDTEIALACASHEGEPRHVEAVTAWLARIGCSVADLECGAHLPYSEAAMVTLVQSGGQVTAAHNNCSGKHTGFLTLARHLGFETKGYIKIEHPVQQRVLGVLESMTGLDLRDAPRGVDGCGIPVIGISLGNTALAMARLADPGDQPEARQAACVRIRQAMTAEPFMVAGSKRFCTSAIQATAGRAVVKTGAEGVFCAAISDLGLGIALKVDDGAKRAAEATVSCLLHHFGIIDESTMRNLVPPLRNWSGREVGAVRVVADSPI